MTTSPTPEGFARTLQIAATKDVQAKVLERAATRAKAVSAYDDARTLADMARECRDYAAALRETAGGDAVEDGAEQGELLP